MTRDDRIEYAKNVSAALGGDGCALVGREAAFALEADAGMGKLASNWRDCYLERANLCATDPELREVLVKSAGEAPTDPVGAVFDLRELDRVNGWDMPDPATQMFSDTPSTAREKMSSVVLSATGRYYAVSDVERVPDDLMVGVIGKPSLTGYSARTKAAALADPVTGPVVESFLDDAGVTPLWHSTPKTDWAVLARTPS
jgi:hypothetical protein